MDVVCSECYGSGDSWHEVLHAKHCLGKNMSEYEARLEGIILDPIEEQQDPWEVIFIQRKIDQEIAELAELLNQ